MKLSVVVCVRNGEATLEDALKSIRANNPSELIVVYGKSSDRTVSIAKKYADKLFFDKGKSLAYARNLGLKKAKENFISFTDADTIVPSGVYDKMFSEMKSNGWVGIHSQIVAPKTNNYLEWAEDKNFKVLFNSAGVRHRIGTIVTIWDKRVLLRYRFDPFLRRTSEDQDVCIRLVNDGFLVGVSESYAFHHHRTGFRKFARQKFQYGEGNARLAWKHGNPKFLINWALIVPYILVRSFQKKQYLTGLALIPYAFLNTLFTGSGVFYRFVKLFFGVNK